MNTFRTESESLGDFQVPSDKLWGAQIQRSLEHFSIGADLIPREMIASFVLAPNESVSPMPLSRQPTLDGAQALTSREFRVQKLRPLFGAGSCGI